MYQTLTRLSWDTFSLRGDSAFAHARLLATRRVAPPPKGTEFVSIFDTGPFRAAHFHALCNLRPWRTKPSPRLALHNETTPRKRPFQAFALLPFPLFGGLLLEKRGCLLGVFFDWSLRHGIGDVE